MLIRVWEKRYGLWSPVRDGGGQRLYQEDDLLLLCYLVQRMEQEGGRIGELAALGRERLLQQMRENQVAGQGQTMNGPALHGQEQAPGLETCSQPLLEAAARGDSHRIQSILDRVLLDCSMDQAVYQVLLPVMAVVGEQYLAGRINVAGEHLISNMIEHCLRNCIAQAGNTLGAKGNPTALCCCFPEEEHRIGLLGVAYGLSRAGHHVIYLGENLPLQDLGQIIGVLHPESVWMSVTSSRHYGRHRSELVALIGRHRLPFVVGGQGAPSSDPLFQGAGGQLWTSGPLNAHNLQSCIGRGIQ